MAEAAIPGLVIPTAFASAEETLSEIYDFKTKEEYPLISNIINILNGTFKLQEAILEHSSEQTEKIEKIHETQEENTPKPKILTLRDKLTLMWEKLRKNKWFQKIGDSLQNLAEKGGGFLIDLLKFLMFGAFFPGVFKFLVKFFINIGIMLIKLLADMLPFLIDTFISLVPWLGKALADAVPKIAAAFVRIFDVLGKKIPALKFLFDFLSWLITGPLVKVLQWLFKHFELTLFAFSAFVLIMKGLPYIMKIASAAQTAYAAAVWLVTSPVGLVILALVALAAAFIAIWLYKDKIIGFFERIFEWFKKLSFGAKILVAALAVIAGPLTLLAAGIYGLAKLFQYIDKVGFSVIIDNIKNFFLDIWNYLPLLMSLYISAIKTKFKNAGETIWELAVWVFDLLTWPIRMYIKFLITTYSFLQKLFRFLIRSAGSFVSDLWRSISGMFSVQNLISKIKNTVDIVFGPGAWESARRKFSRFISNLVGKARSVLQGLFDLFKGMWVWARSGFGKFGGPSFRESLNITAAQRLGSEANTRRIQAAVRSGEGGRVATELLRGSSAANQNLIASELQKLRNVSGSSEQRQAEIANILNRISDKLSARGRVTLADTDSNGG